MTFVFYMNSAIPWWYLEFFTIHRHFLLLDRNQVATQHKIILSYKSKLKCQNINMRTCHAQCSYCRDDFTLKYCRVWLNAPHNLITKTKDMGSIVSSPLKVDEHIIFCYCKNIYKHIFLLLFPCWTDSPSTWEPEMFFSGNVYKAIGKRCNILSEGDYCACAQSVFYKRSSTGNEMNRCGTKKLQIINVCLFRETV